MKYFLRIVFFVGIIVSLAHCKKNDIHINNTGMEEVPNMSSMLKVHFFDTGKGVTTTYNHCYRTIDGGDTWISSKIHNLPLAEVEYAKFYFYSETRLFVTIKTITDEMIYMSANLGKSWKLLITQNEIDGFGLSTENRGIVQSNGYTNNFTLTDSSLSFTNKQNNLSIRVHVDEVIFCDSLFGYISDNFNNKYYVTEDGGFDWNETTGESDYPVNNFSSMSFYNSTGIAVGERGHVRHTKNKKMWTEIFISDVILGASDISYLDCQILNDDTYFLFGNSSFIRILNGEIEEFFQPDGSSLQLYSGSFIDADTGFGITNDGQLYKIRLK